ncbi:hypothetical protein PHMEG_0003990 [Phytophthora megakarya]|uniref:Carbohydrate-binding protein n=1 Tax=Phytophthora megakarya TaxID=4795 RepID=A0A225WWJ8_9STRA|nr:hypothetical protein PHMEG_0003990 [Phytophthora megakarya]
MRIVKMAMTAIVAATFAGLTSADEVSVVGDAVYSITSDRGPICAGSGAIPAGTACPLKDDVAIAGCSPNLPSYTSSGCVAPVDAECAILDNGSWGCVFPDESSSSIRESSDFESSSYESTHLESSSSAGENYNFGSYFGSYFGSFFGSYDGSGYGAEEIMFPIAQDDGEIDVTSPPKQRYSGAPSTKKYSAKGSTTSSATTSPAIESDDADTPCPESDQHQASKSKTATPRPSRLRSEAGETSKSSSTEGVYDQNTEGDDDKRVYQSQSGKSDRVSDNSGKNSHHKNEGSRHSRHNKYTKTSGGDSYKKSKEYRSSGNSVDYDNDDRSYLDQSTEASTTYNDNYKDTNPSQSGDMTVDKDSYHSSYQQSKNDNSVDYSYDSQDKISSNPEESGKIDDEGVDTYATYPAENDNIVKTYPDQQNDGSKPEESGVNVIGDNRVYKSKHSYNSHKSTPCPKGFELSYWIGIHIKLRTPQ